MRQGLRRSVLIVLLLSAGLARAGDSIAILDTKSFWRVRTVRETEETVLPSGEVGYFRVKYDRNWFRQNKGETRVAEGDYKIVEANGVRLPENTSSEWMAPTFDDSAWVRGKGPIFTGEKWGVPMESRDVDWKLILMRGRFKVTDPADVNGLSFSLSFRGGAVVYVNGVEVTRASMPGGKISTNTPALPYPHDVYFSENGYLIWRADQGELWKKCVVKRIRHIKQFRIPGSALRKGVNVIAVSIHRAPTPIEVYRTRVKRYPMPDRRSFWCKVGLVDVELTAPPGAPVVPNRSAPKERSFQVWNHSIVRKVLLEDYPDPFAELKPVRLAGVRNGTFAGQVVCGDDVPIRNLQAAVSNLTGPETIPAKAITLRYARPDGAADRGKEYGAFDSLEDEPLETVPVYKQHGGSCQPIWINVDVPADAKPGDYEATVTITADGVEPVEVPLKLRVIDWTFPDANEFVARMDVAQSPESLAMAYDVELWSDEHLKLLDRTFSLLKPLAVKTLFVTAIRRTHWGNEHAMVRWVREDGELRPNFTIVEKYLDVATKHLGKIPGVILYCWEPLASMGHAGGAGSARRTKDKPIMYTLWDKKRDKLKKRKGPAWGTPEAKAFWKKFNEGILPVLKKRGLEGSMLYGLIGDVRPTKQAMDDITTGVEDPLWAAHSHYYCTNWKGYDLGMAIALWGIGCSPVDPSRGYGHGWRNSFWIAYYPREMSMRSTLVEHRIKLEKWVGAKSRSESVYGKAKGARGLGRLGADFWIVLPDGRGRVRYSLAGRYPESYWGQLNLNYGIPYLLGRGRDGAVPTVRSEAFRENVQEVEARVFIEKALTDKEKRAQIGEDLATRCRAALDKRIRMGLHAQGEGRAWFISSGWNERTEQLFRLAAEVAKALEE